MSAANLSRLLRLFNTVRHLRMEQMAYRLYYRLAKPLVVRQALAPIAGVSRRTWLQPWAAPLVMPRCHLAQGNFEFLGERGQVQAVSDWNAGSKGKLWLYNLHYLDDLNALAADDRADQQAWLIQRWIDDNPPLSGNGWEPYPLSLRLVNLVKWCARQPQVPVQWLASMARQAQALVAQEERHILANHLFANGKALVFAGAFFADDSGMRWLKRGLAILDREITEQFLPDGGHFELSPMYHAILLWDMCDLVNLAERSGFPELSERVVSWRSVIERGLVWLEDLCHPDGEIAFFNDAAFGVAPHPREIRSYAVALGCNWEAQRAELLSCVHFADTGYITVQLGQGGKACLDVAEVGPSYQPGHAHADTLSFELSLFGQRVLVNSGTSQYGEDAERRRQRGTAAHNTVEIDGQDSSEIWAGFRVARRARPVGLTIVEESAWIRVRCAHDGYRRLSGAPMHEREWVFTAQNLRVVDTIKGPFRKVVGRFYLHPHVLVVDDQVLRLPGGQIVRWSVAGGRPRVVAATWHPSFGTVVANHCIEIQFDGAEATINFSWE